MSTQVDVAVQAHGEGIARRFKRLGRAPDRSGGAGVRSRMQQVYLRLIEGLTKDRRTATDLTDQPRSHLPGDVAVRTAPVHIPTGQRLGHDKPPLPRLGTFEVATAIWLLGYAQDENQLVDMVRNIRVNLAENGVFVALCPNPEISWETAATRYPQYGLAVDKTFPSGARQGCRVEVLMEPSFTFESFFWPRDVLERSLRRGGFDELTWHPATVSDEAINEFGADFWSDFLENPTFAVVTMRPTSVG